MLIIKNTTTDHDIRTHIEKYPEDLHTNADGYNSTPPLHSASHAGHDTAIRTLIELGADPNTADNTGNTALHSAIHAGDDTAIRTLIELGADPNAADKDGGTALHDAIHAEHDTAIRTLIELGADPNAADNDGDTALHHAIYAEHDTAIRTLIELGADPNATNNHGYTALHSASHAGHDTAIRTLIELGADLNATNNYGYTALYHAIHAGDDTAIRTLIELGADPNAADKDGYTALHHASHTGHNTAIRTLIELGADPNAATHNNLTLANLALMNRNTLSANILFNAGARFTAQNLYHLATLYHQGEGISKPDERRAIYYYHQAAMGSHKQARTALNNLENNGDKHTQYYLNIVTQNNNFIREYPSLFYEYLTSDPDLNHDEKINHLTALLECDDLITPLDSRSRDTFFRMLQYYKLQKCDTWQDKNELIRIADLFIETPKTHPDYGKYQYTLFEIYAALQWHTQQAELLVDLYKTPKFNWQKSTSNWFPSGQAKSKFIQSYKNSNFGINEQRSRHLKLQNRYKDTLSHIRCILDEKLQEHPAFWLWKSTPKHVFWSTLETEIKTLLTSNKTFYTKAALELYKKFNFLKDKHQISDDETAPINKLFENLCAHDKNLDTKIEEYHEYKYLPATCVF